MLLFVLCTVGALAQSPPPLFKLGGRVMLDTNQVISEPRDPDAPWLDIRRARVHAYLQPHEGVKAKLDFNLEKMSIHDLYVDLGPKTLRARVGRSKTPISNAFLESSQVLPFAERPMMHDVLQSSRYQGVGLMSSHDKVFAEIAGGQVDLFQPDVASTEGYAHVIVKPVDVLWLTGSTGVGSHKALQPEFVTAAGTEWASVEPLTGLGTRSTLGIAAWPDRWRIDSEVFLLTGTALEPLTAMGAYGGLLFMITGEPNPFSKQAKAESPMPKGPGAFEVGARLEHVQAWGATTAQSTAVTGGLTWYAHPNVKWLANVVWTDLPARDETALILRWQANG